MRIKVRLARFRLGTAASRVSAAALDKGRRSRDEPLRQSLPSTSRILNVPEAWSMLHAEVFGKTRSTGTLTKKARS
ncbi:MAG TPA: hypothetical protein VIN77_00270 [Aurantimonas sp.]